MQTAEERIEIEAIGWRLRAPTLDDAGWAAFTAWLEADPAHARAYDLVALAEDDADAVLRGQRARAIEPEIETAPRRSTRPAWMAAAAAAMVAIVAGGVSLRGWAPSQPDRIVVTGPGQHRAITLADGSVVALNADSRLAIASGDARRVRLEQGEASFQIVHHADHPFEVVAGSAVLRDVGTMFNVVRRSDGIEVAVGEGSVAYNPDGPNVVLAAGQAARAGSSPATLEVYDVDRKTVGSWRDGKLVYRDAPLRWVAADVGRAIGKHVEVDPDLANRRFSGTIIVTRGDSAMRLRLGGLLDVAVVAEAGGWRLRSIQRSVTRAGN